MTLRQIAITLLCSSTVLLLGCGPSQHVQRSPSQSFTPQRTNVTPSIVIGDTKILAVSDSISLSVWGYPEFSTRTVVKAAGTITVPLLGEISAAGMTKEQLKSSLESKLAEYIKGEIKLGLEVIPEPPRITVLGSVANPGSFPATYDLPLLEVLARAGGWTTQAELRYIKINRPPTETTGGEVIDIDLQFVLEEGNVRDLPLVKPGDAVYVPMADNYVRELAGIFMDALLLLGLIGLIAF